MQSASILIVDPDAGARGAVVRELSRLGHSVEEASSARHAVSRLRERPADLVVLEWALPDLAGVDVLHEIKRDERFRPTRILMTSSKGAGENIVLALDSGADDFLTKPFSMDELRARVTACLRRPPAPDPVKARIEAGPIVLDDLGHRVLIGNTPIDLAPREYGLLHFFMNNPDRLYSRKQILAYVWGHNDGLGERTVDVHVRRLRRLLEPFGCQNFIQTIRSGGYRFSINALPPGGQRPAEQS